MHPLPEDVSRKSTFDIVKKLRCEAREGVLQSAMSIKALENTYIGFDFDLTMTENNNANSGLLEFINPYVGGKFTLTVKGERIKSGRTGVSSAWLSG